MDKLGTVKGGFVDLTIPDGRIDPETKGVIDNRTNKLVHHNNGSIITKGGIYNPDAVKKLGRAPNPQAEKVYSAIVSKLELIRAVFPHERDRAEKEQWKEAQQHWKWLKEEGFVDFEVTPEGYRFIPTEELGNQKRALNKAIKTAKKARARKPD